MRKSLLSLFRKEFLHILRDRQSLFLVLTMPLLMLMLYGYAVTMDMKAIDLVISDLSGTARSRELIRHIDSTDFFKVTLTRERIADRGRLFQSGGAQCILEIPREYGRIVTPGQNVPLQLSIDASDPNGASFILNYVTRAVGLSTEGSISLFEVEPRIFYNPDMRSAPFFIPGLIALILLLICALLTSIAIVREKESGTMEQLLVSPVRPSQIIIGKVLPYTILGFLDGLIILGVGSLLFRVPVAGSLLLVMAMMLIYVVTGLSLGMLVSTLAKTQAVAMLVTVSMTVLPSMLMSGFIFPISSMPRIFQLASRIVPATYFLEIIRGIVLKGNGMANLYRPAGILLGLDIGLILLSIRSFHIRLE